MTCCGWTAAGQTCSFEVKTLSDDCGLASNPVFSAIRLAGIILCTVQYLHIISKCITIKLYENLLIWL